jgi:hypothetical protein
MALKNEINTAEASSGLAHWLGSKFGGTQPTKLHDAGPIHGGHYARSGLNRRRAKPSPNPRGK